MQMQIKKPVDTSDRSIGAVLIDSGKLSIEDVEPILLLQKSANLRFGDAAIELGLLKQEDIQYALARQFDYPYLIKGESRVSAELVAAYQPFSSQVESFRALRSQLMLRWFTGEMGHKALTIISPMRGEGRSYLAANLAVLFSQLGEQTLLIDGDMRNPRQDKLFHLKSRIGLSDILAGRSSHLDVIEPISSFANLSVLPSGTLPPNPQELLGRRHFGELLEELGREFDVILIDTPAGMESTDAQTVSICAGAALLVARKHQSQINALRSFANSFTHSTVELVGTVVNDH